MPLIELMLKGGSTLVLFIVPPKDAVQDAFFTVFGCFHCFWPFVGPGDHV
jgi:hypothetical protein